MDTALKRLIIIAAVCLILGYACQAFARSTGGAPALSVTAVEPSVGS